MEHKCSYLMVFEVFLVGPTAIHFIKEVGRRINLAPTSVRNHINSLLKQDLIKKKKAKPFDGYIANRENDDFIFYKRAHNFYSLKELTDFLVSVYYPKLIVSFGSYAKGEDIENSDIDVFILSKTKKEIDLGKFERKLKRKLHLIVLNNLNKLDLNLRKKIWNGTVLYGGF